MDNQKLKYIIAGKLSNALEIKNTVFEIQNAVGIALEDFNVFPKKNEIILYELTVEEKAFNMFFVAKHTEGLSENSLKYYKTILNNVFKSIGKPFLKLTTDDIRMYLAKRNLIDKISKVTLNNERRVLNSFYNWSFDEGYAKINPMTKIKNIKEDKIIKKAFTEEDLENIRNNAKNLRDSAIIEFLNSTAVRISEMTELNIADLDIASSSCVVMGKGSKERVVYLNVKAKMALKKYLASRQDNSDALFVSFSKPHNRLSKSAIALVFKKIGLICGIKKVHPHRFRRTTATIALNRGMPMEQVSQMLGHSKIETTTIYARSNQENLISSHKKFIT